MTNHRNYIIVVLSSPAGQAKAFSFVFGDDSKNGEPGHLKLPATLFVSPCFFRQGYLGKPKPAASLATCRCKARTRPQRLQS